MKKSLLFSLSLFAAASVLAAEGGPKDEVTGATTALGNAENYSWRTTVEVGASSRFHPGPTGGKTQKDGLTSLTLSFNDSTTRIFIQGAHAAIKTPDNDWQSATEVLQDTSGGFSPAIFAARMAKNFKSPATDAANLAAEATDLKAGTNGISGSLPTDVVKTLLTFRRAGDATVTNSAGSVTFWVTEGKLAKYQVHVSGTVSFNGNDREVDLTTTTEIKDVGATKIEVPDDAKKKLE